MEFKDVITDRRSIRKFKLDPVPDELIKELIGAARLAPSGSNLQPSRFIVIKSDEARAKLKNCTQLKFVHDAPVTIICCADSGVFSDRKIRYSELQEAGAFMDVQLLEGQDMSEAIKKRIAMPEAEAIAYLKYNVAIAIDHLTLMAHDIGLGACWIGMFDHEAVKREFDIDSRYHVVALIPVGYPDQNPKQRPRIPLKDILIKTL
jgi:nitroreductase